MPEGETSASSTPFGRAVARRITDLRLEYPEIRRIDVDLVFLAFLSETSRFGRFSYGPVSIDTSVVEELYLRRLPTAGPDTDHVAMPSYHAFYERLAVEAARAGTRRPNELHYLLAFMRFPSDLPALVFGELGIPPEAVEAFSRQPPRMTGRSDVFLTPEDVADRLSVNVQTVRAWIRSGKLPASRLAGRRVLRIRESDLEAVLEPVDPADFAEKGQDDAEVRP
jgi:excisionase family DNA binding protein